MENDKMKELDLLKKLLGVSIVILLIGFLFGGIVLYKQQNLVASHERDLKRVIDNELYLNNKMRSINYQRYLSFLQENNITPEELDTIIPQCIDEKYGRDLELFLVTHEDLSFILEDNKLVSIDKQGGVVCIDVVNQTATRELCDDFCKGAPVLGASCATVAPESRDQCCRQKGAASFDVELQKCVA